MKGSLEEAIREGHWRGSGFPANDQIAAVLESQQAVTFEKGYPKVEMKPGTVFLMGKVGYGDGVNMPKLEGWKDDSDPRLSYKTSSGKWIRNDVQMVLYLFALRKVVQSKSKPKLEPVKLCFVREIAQRTKNKRMKTHHPTSPLASPGPMTPPDPMTPLSPMTPSDPLASPVPSTPSADHDPLASPVPSPTPVSPAPMTPHSPLASLAPTPFGAPVPGSFDARAPAPAYTPTLAPLGAPAIPASLGPCALAPFGTPATTLSFAPAQAPFGAYTTPPTHAPDPFGTPSLVPAQAPFDAYATPPTRAPDSFGTPATTPSLASAQAPFDAYATPPSRAPDPLGVPAAYSSVGPTSAPSEFSALMLAQWDWLRCLSFGNSTNPSPDFGPANPSAYLGNPANYAVPSLDFGQHQTAGFDSTLGSPCSSDGSESPSGNFDYFSNSLLESHYSANPSDDVDNRFADWFDSSNFGSQPGSHLVQN